MKRSELGGESTLQALIENSGGFDSTFSTSSVTVK